MLAEVTQRQENDEVTLLCSVKTYGECRLKVKWLLQGQDVDKENREIKTSQSPCSASVTFQTSHFSYTTRSKLFKCEVTDENTERVQVFFFSPQSLATTETYEKDSANETSGVWLYIVVAVGLAALLIIVVAVVGWRKSKANATQMDDHIMLTSNPAVTHSAPESCQDTVRSHCTGVLFCKLLIDNSLESVIICSKM
ncbi:uncharacterized protein isoform X2 [Notothenia coriiceps]|uniref:Uncharacterized protein isoform X2 n=1 Tax=Notothenia coriiceps TaxID=8208 RepID=A0A6I9PMZ8_9TELE|nr:PREDICTED: uncharacterized protein LOC104965121 isoform X2 [Notothenia coriiceps]